jgi:pSer/pThr/pTyr-binding forkhead associated (FHA) protein
MGSTGASTSRFVQATTGVNAGCVYVLGKSSTLGRSPGAHVQVMDPQVSREHAVLEHVEQGNTVLRDLGSVNGTYVNDKRIRKTRIRSGQTFRIGTSEFLFGEVKGDVVDTESLNRAVKVVSVRAMRATTLVAEGLETMRKKLTEPADELRDEAAGGDATGDCQDPLHDVARARGWAHCPACGVKIVE